MNSKSDKFRWLIRLGYFARGALYSLIGLIALTGAAEIARGETSVFDMVSDLPGGTPLLLLMTVGLAGFGLFRLLSAVLDIENEGTDKTGIAKRAGHFGSAVGHFALAHGCYRFATTGSGSGNTAQDAAAGVLSLNFGPALLGLVGLAFLAASAFQARKGISGEFMNRIASDAPEATRWLGGAGYVARAVVFLVIGWSIMQAGWFDNSAEIQTIGGAMAALADSGLWFTLVAIGLLLFGLFSLVLARYRIIPPMNISGRAPAFRH